MKNTIYKYFTAILLSFTISGLFAQDESDNKLKLSGYYENQFFPQMMDDKLILQDYNKLRLNLSSKIGDNMSFNGNYNYKTVHGATKLNTFDILPKSVVSDYAATLGSSPDSLRDQFGFELRDENYLDNAYISLYTKHVNVRVGKQQLPWGSGYAWNPTDIFNSKNMMDPTYEKVGVNAFKLEIPFHNDGLITGVISTDKEWETSIKAIKVKEFIGGFDVSASFIEKEQVGFDYYTFTELTEKRQLIGGDFSGAILGIGIWAEGAYNIMENTKDFGQYVIGADYTFGNGLYLMSEYYRNDLGKTDKSKYDFNNWMGLMGPDGENLSKDYIYFGQMYPIGDLTNWSNYLILNINDKSGMVFPWFSFSLNDNTELILVGYLPFGKKATEFGEFGKGGFARIRIYI